MNRCCWICCQPPPMRSEAENLSPAPSGDVQSADSAARIAPFGVGEGNVMASGEVAMLFEALPDQEPPERLGGGAPRLRYAERGQIEWRPFSLDQLVPEDHRVRLVLRFVEGLDLTPLLAAIRAVEGHAGHAPADPRILLALWLYATVTGIGSAGEVSRLCAEHLAFQWLCGGVGMNAKTLADFRVDHGAVLERLLVDSFTALVRADRKSTRLNSSHMSISYAVFCLK